MVTTLALNELNNVLEQISVEFRLLHFNLNVLNVYITDENHI